MTKLKNLAQFFRALTGDAFFGITTTENFGCVEKRHALRQLAEQERGVHFAAAFNEQAGHVF